MPLPTLTKGLDLPDDQFANMSVAVKNSCAPYLVPLLRPQLPAYGYLAADPRSNTILAIDTYANLKKVRSIIAELDARTKPGKQCATGAREFSPSGLRSR
jgi:type II/III secretion system protein